MTQLIAANWKMYKNASEATQMVEKLGGLLKNLPSEKKVIIFPPFTCLKDTAAAVRKFLQGSSETGAQNVYPAEYGAFTGEISPSMIQDCRAGWVLTGHSERRHILGERDDFIAKKVHFSLAAGLKVMLCVGEKLEEREKGQLEEVLKRQLSTILQDVSPTQDDQKTPLNFQNFAVAYEPVWAIGTGKKAGDNDIIQAHEIIRNILVSALGDLGKDIAILYGGSVKPENAGKILTLDNVGGLLVGGASLEAESFAKIVLA